MKLFRLFAIAAMAMLSAVGAQAGVVIYSNMGADGLTDTSGGDAADITSSSLIASGFTTGSTVKSLASVSLVAQSAIPGNKTVSIFSDNGAGSPGSLYYVSNSTLVAAKDVYTFGFAPPIVLAANTTYWILPEPGLTWFLNDNTDVPTAQNASGYTFFGAKNSINGVIWLPTDGSFTLSLAVPEPALSSLLCFGGIALIRRRMKK